MNHDGNEGRAWRDCSSVISSDAFIPFNVISLKGKTNPQDAAEKLNGLFSAYQPTILLLPSQSLLPLNLA